jgi:hypothetical protein
MIFSMKGEHVIFVNGADKNASTATGRLMHDMRNEAAKKTVSGMQLKC